MPTVVLYPQADPETTAADAVLLRTDAGNPTFDSIRNGAGTSTLTTQATTGLSNLVASSTTDKFLQAAVAYFAIDTAVIRDDAEISSATFQIYGSGVNTGLGDTTLELLAGSAADPASPANADYATNQALTTKYADSGIALTAWNTSGYNSWTLNAAGLAAINKTGVTQFHVALDWHRANSFGGVWASGARSDASGNYADATGTTQDPKLTVVYPALTVSPDELTITSSLHAIQGSVINKRDPIVSYVYTTPFNVAVS